MDKNGLVGHLKQWLTDMCSIQIIPGGVSPSNPNLKLLDCSLAWSNLVPETCGVLD